jgi:hypothetical protein
MEMSFHSPDWLLVGNVFRTCMKMRKYIRGLFPYVLDYVGYRSIGTVLPRPQPLHVVLFSEGLRFMILAHTYTDQYPDVVIKETGSRLESRLSMYA